MKNKKMLQTDSLTIAQIASIFKLNTQTLRFYHRIGLFVPSGTNSSGYRTYSFNQIYTLAMICFLRKANCSIDEIKRFLTNSKPKESINHLKELVEEIEEEKKKLEYSIKLLTKRINYIENISQEINTDITKAKKIYFKQRHYFILGNNEFAITHKEFFEYPTIAIYNVKEDSYSKQLGSYIETEEIPYATDPENLRVIPQGNYLVTYFEGNYSTIYHKIIEFIKYYKKYKLSNRVVCQNIIDQFIHVDYNQFIVSAQFLILE